MTGIVTTDWRGPETPAAKGRIQDLDARLRIVIAVAFSVLVVAMNSLPALIAAVAGASALAVLARLPTRPTLRRMLAVDAFILVILIFLPFTVPGRSVFSVGPLTATAEGVHQAIEIVLTTNAIVLALLALVGTIEPVTLGHALFRLGVPDKLVQMLLLTVRYISVLHQEYARLRLAMTARAFRARGTLHTWRSLGWLFGMLLARSFERAERILAAMKCRGFAGHLQLIDASAPGVADYRFGLAAGAALVVLAAVEAIA
jgi:cobalt/nickel transport system permease protein